MALPYYDKLPWKTMWWSEDVILLEHGNVTEGRECWESHPNNNLGRGPHVDEVKNQRPPTQKPPFV